MVVAEVPATEPDRCRSPHVLPGLRARRATATSHARLPRPGWGLGIRSGTEIENFGSI